MRIRPGIEPLFDVVVVGAGPAGCAAAIRLATHGMRVGLAEKAAYPRDLPGEALHPDVDPLFDELGIRDAIAKAGFVRCPGWIRKRSSERTFVPFLDESGLRLGYQAWRGKLDSILLAHARRLGVKVNQPANIGELVLADGQVVGIAVGGERWFCRHLVDASGASRWLTRQLRLPVKDFSPKLIARFTYFRRESDIGTIPEFRDHRCGWTWLAVVKKDRCQCVQLSLRPTEPLPLPDCLPPDVRFRGANVTWRLVPGCAGPGYFLCGDAAGVLDPAASSGVARALESGLEAADLIIQIARQTLDSERASARYREWYAARFIEQARQLASRYAELEDPPHWLRDLESRFAQLDEFLAKPLANAGGSVIPSC